MKPSTLPNFRELLAIPETSFARAKSICTLGTSTSTVEALVKLLDAGMSGVRILMSQYDQKAQLDVLRKVREAKGLRPQSPCCVLLETRGADLVVGIIKHHQTITLAAGQEVQLINSAGVEGDSQTLICAYEYLPKLMKNGDFVYFDEGAVICMVTEVLSNGAMLVVVEGGDVSEKKSITIPGGVVSAPTLSDRDEDDITNVVLKQSVDYVVLSHVHSAAAVEQVRELLVSRGSSVKVLVKVQNRDVLEEFEDLITASDGIVISPFDLSLEVPPDRYAPVQEALIAHANARGKPVLLLNDISGKTAAWGRLENYALSTAIVTGVDGLVFAKSASAELLAQSIKDWKQLCAGLESSLHFRHHATHSRSHALRSSSALETACEACVLGATESHSSLIVLLPGPDFSLETMMKFRPLVPILVVSPHEIPASCLVAGCFAVKFVGDSEAHNVSEAINRAKEWGVVGKGQRAMVVSGTGYQSSLGTIKVVTVG